jgi:hypothetical protein
VQSNNSAVSSMNVPAMGNSSNSITVILVVNSARVWRQDMTVRRLADVH